MRHAKLHRPGSAVQAVLQLRGGRVGAGLHPVHPPRRPAAVRLVHPEGDLLADLQPPVQGARRHLGDARRPGPRALAPAAQPGAPALARARQGAPLPHARVRPHDAARQLLLPGAEALAAREGLRALDDRRLSARSAQPRHGELTAVSDYKLGFRQIARTRCANLEYAGTAGSIL